MKEAQEIDQRREAKHCVGTTASHVSAHAHTQSKTTDHPNVTGFIFTSDSPGLFHLHVYLV